MKKIRDLFSESRPIDRRIEKVIDYYADDEERLATEIDEYEATDNVEANFRKFLEAYQTGVQSGQVTEVGIWVSGFYGSGKSSFTKYLGFSLDPNRKVNNRPFRDLLKERLRANDVRALLGTVAQKIPTAVVMLDLGRDQLSENASSPVTNVLYWKVLQHVGFSKEKKLAQLELSLTQRGLYEKFKEAYKAKFNNEWEKIHNDALLGVSRASQILTGIMPQDFPNPDTFLKLQFDLTQTVDDLAKDIIELIRKKSGTDNIIFLIDEAGQYVAHSSELILNMDGLARAIKEVGKGKVWIVATGQQTLAEIVEKAALNSTELNKLRDRFPIPIELDARDVKEITYRRLLTKKNEGEDALKKLFKDSGQALIQHTKLTGTTLYKENPTAEDFVKFYPFLPQHFEVLMELIRILARRTGGVGLRSAIRVIQDVLVDTSHILLPSDAKLADRPVGTLAIVSDFYKTLRADINRTLPHVVAGVDKVEDVFKGKMIHIQVAQAIAALQLLENFPRTAENISALLYSQVGKPPLVEDVRQALLEIVSTKDTGLIEDPQTGGYQFLSEGVSVLSRKRNDYVPSGGEITRIRNEVLKKNVLSSQPTTRLDNVKDVRSVARAGKHLLLGDQEEIAFQIEAVSAGMFEQQKTHWLSETAQGREYINTILWLVNQNTSVEDILPDIVKSEYIAGTIDEMTAERDVAQYARSERTRAEKNRERVATGLTEALLSGVFIFRGRPTPVRQDGDTIETSTRAALSKVAHEVYKQHHLLPLAPNTNLAAKFLEVEHFDRMPADRDPMKFVAKKGGSVRVDVTHPALSEALREFRSKIETSGVPQLSGKIVQDHFSSPPYGWSKDAVRYVFAALLVAGEVEFHINNEKIKTAGAISSQAVGSTLSFNKVGVGVRDVRLSNEALDRAANCLQALFGDQVLPLEDSVSQIVRKRVPGLIDSLRDLPSNLKMLGLSGDERARDLLDELNALLTGDASDAPSRLSVSGAEILEDSNWGRAAWKALQQGGDNDVRRARDLLANLLELESLYPGEQQHVISVEEIERLHSILNAPRFYEQLPDLRSALQSIFARITDRYVDLRHGYLQALKDAARQLQSRPEWLRLEPAEQEYFAGSLTPNVQDKPDDDTPMRAYKALLIRVQSLPGLLGRLERDMIERVPKVEEEISDEVAVIKLGESNESDLIETEKQLDEWLSELREQILAQIKSGKKVRLVK